MRIKQFSLKKLVACICCVAMMIPMCAVTVSSDEAEAATEETAAEDTASEEEEVAPADPDAVPRTEDGVMATMELVTENSNMALYLNEKEVLFALVDKNTGEIWWSNPINADCSTGKKAQIQELKAGMSLVYGEPATRRTVNMNSKVKGKAKFKKSGNTLEVTYTFAAADITVPVTYTLENDYLNLYVDTTTIKEESGDKVITDLSFLTTFGAAEADENGYFVIPDGSGAIVNFNNGKTGYKTYSGKVYGNDITPVEKTAPAKTEQIYFPMYGIVKGNSAMMVVADKGDTAATINAYVSGQNKTSYNTCYFSFKVRTEDKYLMGGESNPLKVFEKRGILVPEIEVRYYPVSNSQKSDVSYIDIADKYRDYLTGDYGVTKSETIADTSLYVDLFGAVMKRESILGFPVNMQHKATTFDEAIEILTQLNAGGADDIVVNYNQWTTDDIKQKVANKAAPASVLGGKSDFNKMMSYAADNNIDIYPCIDNLTFKTGNGYWTMTDTAIRVSNAYSRQIIYDLAYGIENQFYKAMSLLAPSCYDDVFEKTAKSYSKKGLTNISMGSASTVIYGDYGRYSMSREMVKNDMQKNYELLNTEVGSVLADGANAYVLPYIDHITNVPLCSSRFDVFDEDIPFYQLVMHGLKSYSCTPVNGDAQIADTVLKAIASGSNLQFDLVADNADSLKDTLYDTLYYADSTYWTDDAASCYKFSKEILGDVSDQQIVSYEAVSDSKIETVYANGTKITVDLTARSVTKNGKVYSLYDYIGKGVIG